MFLGVAESAGRVLNAIADEQATLLPRKVRYIQLPEHTPVRLC